MAEKDPLFKRSLLESDILLPDGVGIVAASRLLSGNRISKIAGADIHQFLLGKINNSEGKCFYLGSCDSTLEKIKKRIKNDFPNISVESYSPPFKDEFSEEDNESMLAAINNFSPDILFIGMTAPKQEKWANSQRDKIEANIVCSIGAVFDFYAGTVERPSQIWINSGFEWLGRLFKEPKRMWKRYLYYGLVFGFYLIREKAKLMLSRPTTKLNGLPEHKVI